MRRLLSLAAVVAVGLAAPIDPLRSAATADSKTAADSKTPATSTASPTSTASTKPVLTAEQAANLPMFMRTLLEEAGIAEKMVHPWFAWWLRTFGIDPKQSPSSSPTTTASR